MATVDIKVTQFFDRDAVIRRLGPAKAAVYRRAGGTLALIMKRSMRRRKTASAPGSPPHSHLGLLRERIFFAFDSARDSVVVGPQKLNSTKQLASGTVPELLDEGGTVQVHEVLMQGGWWRTGKNQRLNLGSMQTRTRTVRIKARPFTQPALGVMKDRYARLFQNSITA